MLYSLFISPIETIVDWVFCYITHDFSELGIIGAVFGVSLAINFLALPIYNVADSLQEKERRITKTLEPRVKQIKKAFKGDEQFMILSTYYRQNDYNPLYVIRGSVSILIQIPFFMAAYNYLSNNEALRGLSFWIFKDLGAPDGLLRIGTFHIHILPILMTLINFVSGAIYTKGTGLKDKIQVYGIAVVFLALLYNSPSGLVIYWILNNIFSLCKNIVKKMKNPAKVLHRMITFGMTAVTIFAFTKGFSTKKLAFLFLTIFTGSLPLINKLLLKVKLLQFESDRRTDFLTVFLSGLALALLCGFLLPSSAIGSSPDEFSFLGNTPSPLTYIWTATYIFLGLLVIWPSVLCKMFGEKAQKWTGLTFLFILLLALLNTYVFKADYGHLSVLFEIDDTDMLESGKVLTLLSIGAGIILSAFLLFIRNTKAFKFVPLCLIVICFAEAGLGILNVNAIRSRFEEIKNLEHETKAVQEIETEYNLSKTGKNVIVVFLDRAINTFAPEIFAEFPEIEKQFDGFTYYPNTVSFSDATAEGFPPLSGGYEYSPEQMNDRSDEMLRTKHDEALLMMPRLFSEAGFKATLSDPVWPNYKYLGGYQIFDDYPDIHIADTLGKYFSKFREEYGLLESNMDSHCQNGCIDFSVVQALPPFLRSMFYKYAKRTDAFASAQGLFNQISHLYYLPEITGVTAQTNTFTMMKNTTPHESDIKLADDYISPDKNWNGTVTEKHYRTNVSALMLLGKWFDYLKDSGVYDNSRIIIVSDHGYDSISVPRGDEKVAAFSALLLVKDFNSSGTIKTDHSFMTNADTLFLAKEGLPISNINPFTGKELTQDKQNGVNVYTCLDWNPCTNYRDGYQFETDLQRAWHVSDDIFNSANWIPLDEYSASQEGK